jgi:hypothetical protein
MKWRDNLLAACLGAGKQGERANCGLKRNTHDDTKTTGLTDQPVNLFPIHGLRGDRVYYNGSRGRLGMSLRLGPVEAAHLSPA